MEHLILGNAVRLLQEAGIPAERGYPARSMKELTKPTATVSLKHASLRAQTLAALVTVFSPVRLGAEICEITALAAGDVLTDMGASCTVEKCQLDGRTGLFFVEITADFLTVVPKIMLGDAMLSHVEAFTSWRTVDEETGITELDKALWNFRLEEFFPTDALEEEEPNEPFMLMQISENGTETFLNCKWTFQRRIWGPTGIRQIRLGVAESMDVG